MTKCQDLEETKVVWLANVQVRQVSKPPFRNERPWSVPSRLIGSVRADFSLAGEESGVGTAGDAPKDASSVVEGEPDVVARAMDFKSGAVENDELFLLSPLFVLAGAMDVESEAEEDDELSRLLLLLLVLADWVGNRVNGEGVRAASTIRKLSKTHECQSPHSPKMTA